MIRWPRLLVPTLAMLAACVPAARRSEPLLAQQSVSLRARRAELAEADRALAVRAAVDARSLVERTSDGVLFLIGGLPIIRGRERLAQAFDSLSATSMARLAWRSVRVDVSSDGAAGYSLGYGTRAAGADSSVSIRYIAFWTRPRTGRWELAAMVLARGSANTSTVAPRGCETPDRDAGVIATKEPDRAGGAVLAADAAFAAQAASAGPGPAFLATVADDGVSLGGAGPMACGRAALEHAFDGAAPGDLTWQPRYGFVAAGGDLGFSVGIARSRGAAGPGTSKYLTIWKRQPDGGWRFVADGGNAAPPDA